MKQKTALIMFSALFVSVFAFFVYNFIGFRKGMTKYRDERTMNPGQQSMYDALKRGNREEVIRMINAGSSVDMRIPVIRCNDKGADSGLKKMTPLMVASELGDYETAKILIKTGARVNLNDEDWMRTPLIYALISRNGKLIRLLVENGADVNHMERRYRFDTWPIFYAIDYGDRETAELLVKSGADLHVRQTGGETPLSYAASRGREDIKKIVMPKKPGL